PRPSRLALWPACSLMMGRGAPAGERAGPVNRGRRLRPSSGVMRSPLYSAVSPAGAPRPIFWEHEGNKAMREGRWTIVSKHKGAWELYDIEADRTESRDLAAKEPARVKAMAAAWDVWAARVGVEPWAHDIPEGSGSSPTGKKKSAKGE
ncbi:MAG: hypothetical protein ACKOTF_11445, partial [Opitutaceae bacterium]